MLDGFKDLLLQSSKPWVQQMGSYPVCNRVIDGETPSLGACPVSPLVTWSSFFFKFFVLFYLQTLAMSLGSLGLALGVVISLNFHPYGLSMQYIGF